MRKAERKENYATWVVPVSGGSSREGRGGCVILNRSRRRGSSLVGRSWRNRLRRNSYVTGITKLKLMLAWTANYVHSTRSSYTGRRHESQPLLGLLSTGEGGVLSRMNSSILRRLLDDCTDRN